MNPTDSQPPHLGFPKDERSQIFVFRVIWLGLFASSLFFLVPLWQRSSGEHTLSIDFAAFASRFRDDARPELRMLSIVAIGNLAIAILLPQLLTKWALQKSGRALAEIRRESNAEGSLEPRTILQSTPTEAFFAPFVVRLALLDSIAIVGFTVAFIFTRDPNDYLPFLAITQFFFLRYFPMNLNKVKRDLWRAFPGVTRLTATIVTLNEEANLARCLESLRGLADEVVVVDSGSVDRTRAIAEGAGARFIANPWPGYGAQKNFAQAAAANDWILNVDADEAVTPELATEIRALLAGDASALRSGYSMPRRSWYLGRWILHGGWYPNRLVRLADRRRARWTEPAVHEALVVESGHGELATDLLHYPFPNIREQILTNLRYAALGTDELARRGRRFGIWKLISKPIGKFIETYLLKGGCLDGAPGFIISVNAAHSIFLKYATLIERVPPERNKERV